MNKAAINYIIRLLADRFIGAALFFVTAKSFDVRSAVYFLVYIIVAAISGIFMYKWNPKTLAERGKVVTDSPKWDKVLLLIFWISAYFIVYFVAGKTTILGEKIDFWFIFGIMLYLFSAYITVFAMKENTFLESTARIQNDRNQKVIKTGPYSVIRHPTYLSIIIWCFAILMIFPSAGVAAVSAVVFMVICIRTELEDRMLKKELLGYSEYCKKVKYRVIPFVW